MRGMARQRRVNLRNNLFRLVRNKKCVLLLFFVPFMILFGINSRPCNQQPAPATSLSILACYKGQEEQSQMYNPSTTFSEGTNFPIITPHIQPIISDKNLYVVVVVNSGSENGIHRLLRKAIRESWGKDTENNCTIKWSLFFSLGLSQDENSNANNRLEARENNDLIIGQFKDNYKNIPIKTFMAHWWAFNTFSCRYVLKTDDDVYVRVNKLLHWLHNAGSPGRFYGGLVHSTLIITRNPRSKWYISREQFNESSWPPFCHGAFHVLSTDVLPAFFYYTQLRQPFHTDDAYIGVAARDLGIRVTRLRGLMLHMPKTDCQFLDKTAIGHAISPANMLKIHKKFDSLALRKDIKC
ncbi:beta-1,3-galactosyltransferase 1 [Exaiptasia diaphana]|uniref:Hexosyltransferase n=1 Tax=Exaiptasia diaphana TaxID=2652724 RepID=A0A913WZG9_EXADI|nr:beta-1,3-galactosyltransferase 1 [Exaiptasia diaphana]